MKGTLLAERESTVAMFGPGPKSFFARPVWKAQVWHWWKYINCAKEPSALPHVIQWLIDVLGNQKITTWKLWRMPNKDRLFQHPDYPPAKYQFVPHFPFNLWGFKTLRAGVLAMRPSRVVKASREPTRNMIIPLWRGNLELVGFMTWAGFLVKKHVFWTTHLTTHVGI